MKLNKPKIITKYIIKEFSVSLIIFFSIFLCLILLSNYIEEIIYFKDKKINNDFLINIFILALIKTPTSMIIISPFVFLFSGIFYFVKLKKNNEVMSVNLSGISKNFLTLIPATYSFLIGLIIIFIISPFSTELLKYYEKNKQKFSENENLVMNSDNGLWIKEKKSDHTIIIRSDPIRDQNFKSLKNVTIYKLNNNNNFIERTDAKETIIKNYNWELLNVNKYTLDKTDYYFKTFYRTNINFENISNLYLNPNIFSIWNIMSEFNLRKKIGYNSQDLIIQFNKYISLPFMLFFMIFLSTTFTIQINLTLNNFIYSFFGVLAGVTIYFFNDISIAMGKSGKIPLVLSVWVPVFFIMIVSVSNIFKNED